MQRTLGTYPNEIVPHKELNGYNKQLKNHAHRWLINHLLPLFLCRKVCARQTNHKPTRKVHLLVP